MLKRIIKTSFYSFCSRSLLTLTNLCVIFAVSKFLKSTELGIYAITFFFYYLASVFSSYGLKLYLSKETAYRKEETDFKKKVMGEVFNSLIVGFMISIIITVLTLLLYNKIQFSLLIPVMISGLLFGVERNLSGIILGEERMDMETLYQIINVVIVGGLTILTVRKIGILGIYFLRMGASILMISLRYLFLITRGYHIRQKPVLRNFIKKEKNFFFASELLYFILRQIDVFILSFFITKELLGNYFLALRIYLAFALFAEIISSSFTPFISRIYRGKEKRSFFTFNQTVLKYFTVGGLIFSAALFLFRDVIASLFSTDYIATTGHYLMFFSFMLFFRILYYYPGNVLSATEYQNKRFYIVLSSSIIMTLLNIILGSIFSVYGIISSRAVVEIFMFVAFLVAMKKISKRYNREKT